MPVAIGLFISAVLMAFAMQQRHVNLVLLHVYFLD